MTVNILPTDLGKVVAELSSRVFKVEQRASSPNAGAPSSSNTSVDTITIGGIVVGAAASPATNLVLSVGAFMEDIWIDADWDAPADGTANSYDVELARKVGLVYELEQNYRTGSGTSLRMSGLEPSQTYGVRVTAINRIGKRATPTPSSGFQDVTTGLDATIPDQVSNIQLVAGIRTIMATWNEVANRDVARGTGTYEVQVATDAGFTALFASKYTSATIASFAGVVTSTTYYCRVRAIDNSGNAGAWSDTASTTTVAAFEGDLGTGAVTTTKIAALAVGRAQIADLAVDDAKVANLSADKVTIGTLSADRIAANTLDVNKLTSSTLTSKTITIGAGGTLKIGNAPTTGIFINDQGIRLYSGGVAKVVLDVAGTAAFEGNISASTITSSTITSATINSGTITGATIRTAASGKRISLDSGVIDFLYLYTGHASESAPGRMGVTVDVNTLFVQMDAPRSTGNDYGSTSIWSVTGGNGSGIGWAIRKSDGGSKASLVLGSLSNAGVAAIEAVDISEIYCRFADNADIKLKGSGDYAFVYFWGGGTAATLNAVNGLGPGLHVLDGDNGPFHPIQASAFNIASSRETKREIRPEESALVRLSKIGVVRFKRDYGLSTTRREVPMGKRKEQETFEPVGEIPPHIKRTFEMDEIGIIADELLSIVPEAVVLSEGQKPSAINLGVLVALLIKSVQELAEMIPPRKV